MGTNHVVATKETIRSDLQDLGLSSGASVLVHSSLSSIGHVEGGADAVIDALIESVQPEGTILIPTLTGSQAYSWRNPPVFDPRDSPCWTGLIPETVRRRSDAVRSRHPTHSVSGMGPAMDDLIRGHEYCATPCAAESPYGRFAAMGGFILLLGVTHVVNTSLHMVEEVTRVPYHLQERPALARVAREDGSWEEIVTTLHAYGWERNFPKVEPLLRDLGAQKDGTVGRAPSRLIDAKTMRDVLVPLVNGDSLFLLSDSARKQFERLSRP